MPVHSCGPNQVSLSGTSAAEGRAGQCAAVDQTRSVAQGRTGQALPCKDRPVYDNRLMKLPLRGRSVDQGQTGQCIAMDQARSC